jgi:hypothetical protein
MLEILLEPKLHKTGKHNTLQNSTGLYCHKLHILCGNFALAITTLMYHYDKHLDWHSNNPNNPNAQPPCQERMITDGWESEQTLPQAFKQMLDALDMQWSKAMHLKRLAIETASQHGLKRAEVQLRSLLRSIDCRLGQFYHVAFVGSPRDCKSPDFLSGVSHCFDAFLEVIIEHLLFDFLDPT